MQSALIALLRRHAPETARRLLLLTVIAGLCSAGLVIIGLYAVQQTGQPALTTLLLFAILLAAVAACVGAIAPRAAAVGSAVVEDLRGQVIAPVLANRTAEDEVLLAFERLPAPILRGLSASISALVAALAVIAAVAYLLATRRSLGAVIVVALGLSVGLQVWQHRKSAAGSMLPHALARLRDARALSRFSPSSTAAAGRDVLSAFLAPDRATVAQAGASLRARLIELSLAFLLVGVGLYMAYAGQLQKSTLAATLAELLMAAPPLILLSSRVNDIWAGEEAARAWARLEARLLPPGAAGAGAPSEFRGLQLEGVRYGAKERPLGPIDLSVDGGSLVVVQGESGAGKSALLRLLGGSTPAIEGRIVLNESPMNADQAAAALRGFAVALTGGPLPARLALPSQDGKREEATAMLTALQLDPQRFQTEDGLALADAASGEAARLAFAAAMLDPRPLLLLDDAAIDRDPRIRAAIARDWAPRLKARGKTIVIVTEDSDLAAAADRTVRLGTGGTSAPMGTGRIKR